MFAELQERLASRRSSALTEGSEEAENAAATSAACSPTSSPRVRPLPLPASRIKWLESALSLPSAAALAPPPPKAPTPSAAPAAVQPLPTGLRRSASAADCVHRAAAVVDDHSVPPKAAVQELSGSKKAEEAAALRRSASAREFDRRFISSHAADDSSHSSGPAAASATPLSLPKSRIQWVESVWNSPSATPLPPKAPAPSAAAAAPPLPQALRRTASAEMYDIHAAMAAGAVRRQAAGMHELSGAEEAEKAAALRRSASAKEFDVHAAVVAGSTRRKAAELALIRSQREQEMARGPNPTVPPWEMARGPQPVAALRIADEGLRSAATFATGLRALRPVTHRPPLPSKPDPHHSSLSLTDSMGASWSKPAVNPAVKPAAAAFTDFLAASDALSVLSTHEALLACLELEHAPTLHKLSTLLQLGLPHRAKQLLGCLESRSAAPQYRSGLKLSHQRGMRSTVHAVVIGAGPVGLRCAIELAFVGARVEVREARSHFSRLQVHHLWEWVDSL